MQVERVQKWVMSALILTTSALLSGGLVILGLTGNNAEAFPVLTAIAVIIMALAIVGTRVINELRLVTPWLAAALIPLAVALYFH